VIGTNYMAGLPSSTKTEHACFTLKCFDEADGQLRQPVKTFNTKKTTTALSSIHGFMSLLMRTRMSQFLVCTTLRLATYRSSGLSFILCCHLCSFRAGAVTCISGLSCCMETPASIGIETSCGFPDQIMPSSADGVRQCKNCDGTM